MGGRIRTVKPELFTSEDVAALPLPTMVSWIGLWTQCDDWGRAQDTAKVLNGALWPLRVEHTWEDMEEDLSILAERGMICRYEVAGRRYLHVVTWRQHQMTRSTRPLHPGCPEHHPSTERVQQPELDLTGGETTPTSPSPASRGGRSPKDAQSAAGAGQVREAVQSALLPWWAAHEGDCRQSYPVILRIVTGIVGRGMPLDDAMWALTRVTADGKPVAAGTLQYALSARQNASADTMATQIAVRDPASFTHEL